MGKALPPEGAWFDVAIIGAGPAGSALAALVARRGKSVALLERDTFPRDKLCGEFLSSEARGALAEIGCLGEVLDRKPPVILAARFSSPSGRTLEVPFPAPALGLRRFALDAILARHASASGASVFTSVEVRRIRATDASPSVAPGGGVATELEIRPRRSPGDAAPIRFQAGIVVGAYGRRERLDRDQGRAFLRESHPFIGFKRHCRPALGPPGTELVRDISGRVEIHAFEGGYCGISLVETGEVNVCMFLEARFVKVLTSTRWNPLCAALSMANPRLAARMAALRPSGGTLLAVGQVPVSAKERYSPPLLFTGDAAGMIAPICGDGQAMALRSAVLLAPVVGSCPTVLSRSDFERIGATWDQLWRTEFQRRVAMGLKIQPFMLRAGAAETAIRLAKLCPPFVRYLARATRSSSCP